MACYLSVPYGVFKKTCMFVTVATFYRFLSTHTSHLFQTDKVLLAKEERPDKVLLLVISVFNIIFGFRFWVSCRKEFHFLEICFLRFCFVLMPIWVHSFCYYWLHLLLSVICLMFGWSHVIWIHEIYIYFWFRKSFHFCCIL